MVVFSQKNTLSSCNHGIVPKNTHYRGTGPLMEYIEGTYAYLAHYSLLPLIVPKKNSTQNPKKNNHSVSLYKFHL